MVESVGGRVEVATTRNPAENSGFIFIDKTFSQNA
jgi:hypothetical protein